MADAHRPSATPASSGLAIVIGLALLLVLTLLALASVRSARVERGSAARAIAARAAFEAAEREFKAVLAAPVPQGVPVAMTRTYAGDDGSTTSVRVEFDRAHGPIDPPSGFSLGAGTGFTAYPFEATATGTAGGRDVHLRQDFLVIGAADE